jgi:hypothetical protein
VTGSGTSMTWTLTASVPSGVAVGVTPVAVFTTTASREGLTCAAVASGATTVACTGTTTGYGLQGSNVTVLFSALTSGVTSVGTITGPGAAPIVPVGSGLVPLIPGPFGAGPAGAGPLGPAGPGGAPYAVPQFGAAPPSGLAVPPGSRANIPVIPEADTIWMLVAGFGLVAWLGHWRTRRERP